MSFIFIIDTDCKYCYINKNKKVLVNVGNSLLDYSDKFFYGTMSNRNYMVRSYKYSWLMRNSSSSVIIININQSICKYRSRAHFTISNTLN